MARCPSPPAAFDGAQASEIPRRGKASMLGHQAGLSLGGHLDCGLKSLALTAIVSAEEDDGLMRHQRLGGASVRT
jgi:hypothetical protein